MKTNKILSAITIIPNVIRVDSSYQTIVQLNYLSHDHSYYAILDFMTDAIRILTLFAFIWNDL